MIPLVVIALTQTAVFATSVYLHRTLAHRALTVRPFADVLFRTVLWLTTGQRRQEWVAVHRKHHAFTDREGKEAVDTVDFDEAIDRGRVRAPIARDQFEGTRDRRLP